MILSAVHDGRWQQARTDDEADQLLDRIVAGADPRCPSDVLVADRPIDDDTVEYPDFHLRCCANPTAGYAALLYVAASLDPDRIWVSYNPAPPLEDPWLASDLDTGRYPRPVHRDPDRAGPRGARRVLADRRPDHRTAGTRAENRMTTVRSSRGWGSGR